MTPLEIRHNRHIATLKAAKWGTQTIGMLEKQVFLDKPPVAIIDGDIPINVEIAPQSSILVLSHHQSYLTHGLHKFPAKFFPELPRWAIRRYSGDPEDGRYATVCDPMCGSGTVNVEALLERRNSVAIDIDPFARFLTKVKTTPIDSELLDEIYPWLIKKLDGDSDKVRIPDFPHRDDIWFKQSVSKELGRILYWIQEINSRFDEVSEKEKQDLTDFFLICFSAIIREVSNADTKCTRTVVRKRLNKQVDPRDVLKAFKRVADKNVPNMREFSAICPRDVHVDILNNERDARNTQLSDESIDVAVTSPPYINAVDYPRTHQLEMYWLQMIDTIKHPILSRMKEEYIGTESVSSKEYSTLKTFGIEELDEYLTYLFKIDPRRSYIVYRYFVDMEQNLREMKRVLKPESRYCIAIGNNTIRGRTVPSHRFLMKIATDRVKFEIENAFMSEVIRHFIRIPRKERMMNDWILILKNSDSS